MKEITLESIKARLEQLTILELRSTARLLGVESPAVGKRTEVLEKIIAIANGTANPVPKDDSKLTDFADKKLVKDILAYRKSVIGE